MVLASGEPSSPYAPHRPGSILWSDRRKTLLEGAGARFPVTQLSFADAGIAGGRRAAWCLQLDTADLTDSAAEACVYFSIPITSGFASTSESPTSPQQNNS